MKQRLYIDVNASVDRHAYRHERVKYTYEDFVADMEYHRVHASLVRSNLSDYSYVKANRKLLEDIGGNPRLFAVATIPPEIRFDHIGGLGYIDDMIKSGVKAFISSFDAFNTPITVYTLKPLADALIKHDIPLILPYSYAGHCWERLQSILEAYPKLNIIVIGCYWGQERCVFPLMQEYKNLYIDISSFHIFNVLELCKEYGILDQVLFGTSYPNKVMGALKALIEYSNITEEEKDKVAYKTAMKLFKLPMPTEYEVCLLDELAMTMEEGKPFTDVEIIDAHVHIIETNDITVSSHPIKNGDYHGIVAAMDKVGINQSIISTWEGLQTDGVAGNNTLVEGMKKYPGRLLGYATTNPHYKDDLDSVIGYHTEQGFVGLKPYYPFNNYDFLGEKYNEWFSYANEHNLFMLVHCDGTKTIVDKIRTLAEKYPNISFLMGHSGMSFEACDMNLELAKEYPNIYLEITYTTTTEGMIEYMVEKLGADRVLYGSDMPLRAPSVQVAWVVYAKISIEDKKKILAGNINRILNKIK